MIYQYVKIYKDNIVSYIIALYWLNDTHNSFILIWASNRTFGCPRYISKTLDKS